MKREQLNWFKEAKPCAHVKINHGISRPNPSFERRKIPSRKREGNMWGNITNRTCN